MAMVFNLSGTLKFLCVRAARFGQAGAQQSLQSGEESLAGNCHAVW